MKTQQKRVSRVLGALQIFVALGAIPVGMMFVLNPAGNTIGMDPSMLSTGPFSTFLIPGLVLLLVNGVGSLVGAVATFRGHRYAPELAMGLGLFLVVWIAIQFLIVGFSWLQVLYAIVGLLELGLGWRLRQDQSVATRPRRPA